MGAPPDIVPFLPRGALREGARVEWCAWSDAWRVIMLDHVGHPEPATIIPDAQGAALFVYHARCTRFMERALRTFASAEPIITGDHVVIPDQLAARGYAIWYDDPAGEFVASHLDPHDVDRSYRIGVYETAHEAREALWRAARVDYGIERPAHPDPLIEQDGSRTPGPQGAA